MSGKFGIVVVCAVCFAIGCFGSLVYAGSGGWWEYCDGIVTVPCPAGSCVILLQTCTIVQPGDIDGAMAGTLATCASWGVYCTVSNQCPCRIPSGAHFNCPPPAGNC